MQIYRFNKKWAVLWSQKAERDNFVIIINIVHEHFLVPLPTIFYNERNDIDRLHKDIRRLPRAHEPRIVTSAALENLLQAGTARDIPTGSQLNPHRAHHFVLHRSSHLHTDETQRREPLDA